MELKVNMQTWENILCSPDPHQQLFTAFLDRDHPTFQNILKQGIRDSTIDPNHWFEDPHNGTLLDLACNKANISGYKRMLLSKGNPHNHWFTDPYYNKFLDCRKTNNSDYVRTLLEAGADPNRVNSCYFKTPLHFTIEVEDLPSFKLILEDSRTDPNTIDDYGNSPLHYAVLVEDMSFQKKLLQHSKIDVNLKNNFGKTALHFATLQSIVASSQGIDGTKRLDFLIKEGPRELDINCHCDFGFTPLYYAALNGYPKLTLLLLKHGANIGERHESGELTVTDINPTILEKYFDQCLAEKGKICKDDEIIFDYNFLAPPRVPVKSPTFSQVKLQIEANQSNKSDDNQPETELWFDMSRFPDLRSLLKHPIMTSFIHLKWIRVRWFFYINLIFYIFFCTLFTVYILCFYATKNPGEIETSGNGNRPTRDFIEDEQPPNGHLEQILYVSVLVF